MEKAVLFIYNISVFCGTKAFFADFFASHTVDRRAFNLYNIIVYLSK